MPLRKAGFFRELRHGDPNGPSLPDARERIPPIERPRIAGYLRGGSVLASTGRAVGDWFETSNTAVAPMNIRTDGVWVWPGDLAFYVERYGVAVPEELVAFMASRSWVAKVLTEEELQVAEQSMFSIEEA